MSAYADVYYPVMLGVCAALVVVGIATLIWVRLHGVLKWTVTGMWIATAVNIVWLIAVLFDSTVDVDIPTMIGYMLVTVILLPLLGIGRLGEPEAAALDPDPKRPILQPDQVARVDAVAAIIVALTMAVLIWRMMQILGGAA